MNGYDLSRQWFDFAFENTDLVSGNHAGVYLWAVELNNRLGWSPKFGLPSEVAMQAVGIKSYKTYSAIFEDLVSWGFFAVHQRSKNQFTANIIGLVIFTEANTKALDKALDKAIPKQGEKQYQSISTINKPLNKETFKPLNNGDGDFSILDLEEENNNQREAPRTKSMKFNPAHVNLPHGDHFKSAWGKWVTHRTEIKKPLTETAVSIQLKKLSEYDEGMAVNFILQTVEKGWQGIVYEIKSGYTPVSILQSPPVKRATLNDKYR